VLTLSLALDAYASTLLRTGSPGEAAAPATEATSIGEALGAGWLADLASRSMAAALAAMAVSGTGDRAAAAREIRRVITQARDRHTISTAFWALWPLAGLLQGSDAPTAYLLLLAHRRLWATDRALPANAIDAIDPATIAELEERANAINADQLVALALDALERYLAAQDPGGTGA
jgi:hypothetical protein